MKKTRTAIYVIFATLLLMVSLVSASMIIPANENAKENAKAPENSLSIGNMWGFERVDFIHYAKPNNPAKPTNPAKPDKTTTCYKLMGVKWTTFPVSYFINPSNTQGLNEFWVLETISTSAETWDAETPRDLFTDNPKTTFSSYGVQDFQNTIDFGDYPNDGVIAVTSVWYTRVGKQIVEFDMRFNTRFNWGNGKDDNSLMDLQNIATHELGHAVGLADLYTTTCSAVTMYGYSGYGDIEKRSLEPADITGLQVMYGA